MTDMTVLGARSNELRTARAAVRRDLRMGARRALDVLADPPECVDDVLLVDLLRWQRWLGDEKLRRLNVAAIADGVNLCLPVRLCSARTLAWLADELPVDRNWPREVAA